ncbi:MAG: hypothetical protein K2X27_24010 [Candidatus Obscuribacterales bacterium]|nr:hypothetical protein [Candidatus Obscuribacterales bacterium]
MHLDKLSAVYLLLLGLVSTALSFFSPVYMKHLSDRVNSGHFWSALALFMIAMTMLLLSANAVAFLVFWELMSLSSLALVASEHKQRRVQQAGIIYLGATRIATAFLMAGFLAMHAFSHSWVFSDWGQSAFPIWPSFLILIGLCIKAGIWPFHIWLPYAHPAAPSPVSALMSGVMIKIALYAVIRILVSQNLASELLGHVALALGLVSSLWGVLFALVQQDLKKLLAYSSVENLGLILMAIGLAIVAKAQGLPEISLLALSAAILHSFNHGIFKSLLFLSAGAVDCTVHSRDMQQLGGLARKMPLTMAAFLTGAFAISALPPLGGFIGKWMLYQGLLRTAWESSSLAERALGLTSVGTLALVGALALASFAKAFGISFLGNARSKAVAEHASETANGMIFAQIFLSLCALVSGLFAAPAAMQAASVASRALQFNTRTPALAVISLLDQTLYALLLFALIYGVYLAASKRKTYITWECGFGSLSPRCQSSPISFAQPMARIFSLILRFKLLVEITGKDRRNFPEHIKVEPQMVSLLESRVYLPTISWIQNLSRAFAKLQAGSIHLYLLYVCATLVILVLVGTRL